MMDRDTTQSTINELLKEIDPTTFSKLSVLQNLIFYKKSV